MKGDPEEAARILESSVYYRAEWYPSCVRSVADPALREGMVPAMRATMRQYYAGEFAKWTGEMRLWHSYNFV